MVVDLTYTGFEQSKMIPGLENIPYFQFDFSVQPFVNSMTTYLQSRMASDAIFIFESGKGRNCKLIFLINSLKVCGFRGG